MCYQIKLSCFLALNSRADRVSSSHLLTCHLGYVPVNSLQPSNDSFRVIGSDSPPSTTSHHPAATRRPAPSIDGRRIPGSKGVGGNIENVSLIPSALTQLDPSLIRSIDTPLVAGHRSTASLLVFYVKDGQTSLSDVIYNMVSSCHLERLILNQMHLCISGFFWPTSWRLILEITDINNNGSSVNQIWMLKSEKSLSFPSKILIYSQWNQSFEWVHGIDEDLIVHWSMRCLFFFLTFSSWLKLSWAQKCSRLILKIAHINRVTSQYAASSKFCRKEELNAYTLTMPEYRQGALALEWSPLNWYWKRRLTKKDLPLINLNRNIVAVSQFYFIFLFLPAPTDA